MDEATDRKSETADNVARMHYEVEGGLKTVIRLMGSAEVELNPAEPVKLLEVNEGTVPVGIMPLRFAAHPASGVHSPIVIVEITPEEFQRIQTNELPLPHGWKLGEAIPNRTAATA